MKLLFSIPYALSLDITPGSIGEHTVSVFLRSSDWGKTGVLKYIYHIREALKIMVQARRFEALVLCSTGIEAFLIGKWHEIFCPQTHIICADILMPRDGRLVNLVSQWLKGNDAFVCIRRGDIEILGRRFGVPPEKCIFVPFPVNEATSQIPTTEGDYIYSAGWAHRDWPTLIKVLSSLPYRAVLSPGVSLEIPSEATGRIQVLPMQSPESGRNLMANARLIVLALEDTDLPSGPLVQLDAMAMGKPVVATNVNGTRDYVDEGRTALLVPPKDCQSMAAAIHRLMEDDIYRRQVGLAAREDVCSRFTMENFMSQVVDTCVVAAMKTYKKKRLWDRQKKAKPTHE